MGFNEKNNFVEKKSLWKEQKSKSTIPRPAYSSKRPSFYYKGKNLNNTQQMCRKSVRMDGWVQDDVADYLTPTSGIS